MEFQTDAQRACYERILPWMEKLFGDSAIPREDAPLVDLPLGSAWATVAVVPWGEDDATVITRAYVVRGPRIDLELLRMLLESNEHLPFGAFGLDPEGDVFLQHSIVGSTCDPEELEASVVSVVSTADRFDDLIVDRWGGQRALDKYRELEAERAVD